MYIRTTYEEFKNLQKDVNILNRIKVSYIDLCGCKKNTSISAFIYKSTSCKKCNFKNLSKETYEKCILQCKNNNCVMITTFDEFEKLRENCKSINGILIEYNASCGCNSKIGIGSFLVYECGIKCKKCTRIDMSNNGKNEDKSSKHTKMEDDTIEYITNMLGNDYIIKSTDDGSLADCGINIKNNNNDKFLQLQIKTTTQPKGKYSFVVSNKYINCVIICFCQSDKRMWIFDGNNMDNSISSIGLTNSIYNKNEIKDTQELITKIKEYYNKLPLFSFEEINIPISFSQKKEQEHRKNRETKCYFIEFKYPVRKQLIFDFKINNKNIQEKAGFPLNNLPKHIKFNVFRKNGKNKTQAYKKGDNDFYWLNCPDKEHFLIIPEDYIIDRKTIEIFLHKKSSIKSWYDKFLYKYSEVNEEILQIFK